MPLSYSEEGGESMGLEMNGHPPRPTRLGVVGYLNMQPLINGLETMETAPRLPSFEIRHGSPAQLGRWLEEGTIDVGMVPVASLFAHPEWRVVLGGMIGSRGPVQSVLALGSSPPRAWRRLRPDSHSMTSNVMAQVILRRKYGAQFELGQPLPHGNWELPVAPTEGEGMVLIGSRALRHRRDWEGLEMAQPPKAAVLDLGEEWFRWTGLPFVYAIWVMRPGYEFGGWVAQLLQQRIRNLRRFEEIAAAWPGLEAERMTPQEAFHYLMFSIDFDLDDKAKEGLQRFYDEGRALGLFAPGWELKMMGSD